MNVTFETKSKNKAGTHDWLTPPYIIQALGRFDLDPCASEHQFYQTATKMLTVKDDGLSHEWSGRVWCNPPYGEHTSEWLMRCALHGNATALVFARTETNAFFSAVWNKAHSILFLKGRVCFYKPDGTKGQAAGAPSVLISYDEQNSLMLRDCGLHGRFIKL